MKGSGVSPTNITPALSHIVSCSLSIRLPCFGYIPPTAIIPEARTNSLFWRCASGGSPVYSDQWFKMMQRPRRIIQKEHFTHFKRKEHTMIKLALRYTRYALSALATIGFGVSLN